MSSDSASSRFETAGLTVDPRQMLGIEKNPRAARIAEAVLWIGYLQWHYRTRGDVNPPQPVLKDYKNIEHRDALLDWDKMEYVTDERGIPKTRWDGKTMKTHPVTGEHVPDESARAVEERYFNPRKAAWPGADFVVGNPPFIGTSNMRRSLGDGYTDAVRKTYKQVPESADYVMYWWHIAAGLAREGKIKRFGLITTNSIRQTFNRRVVQHHMGQKKPLSLVFAVPDHPWVDSADGADVRIAMTVGEGGEHVGELASVIEETGGQGEGVDVALKTREGRLQSDLRVGQAVSLASRLISSSGISSRGMQLFGSGFIVTREEASRLGLGRIPGLDRHICEYRNGRDITQTPRGVMVIDLFGLSAEEVRRRYPEVYQRIVERVKPERDAKSHSKDGAGYARLWWLFGKPRQELRKYCAGLRRYIATVETSKHRFFVFLDESILPDNMLVNIAVDDPFHLGILSSRAHVAWALAAGGRMGVGNDPRYNKTRCFETFPFPDVTDAQRQHIGDLAEQLDARRKHRQQLHPKLTLTGMYNVLEKLRCGEELTGADKVIHEQGLVTVIGELHDELDAAVLDAYGWRAHGSGAGGQTRRHNPVGAQVRRADRRRGRLAGPPRQAQRRACRRGRTGRRPVVAPRVPSARAASGCTKGPNPRRCRRRSRRRQGREEELAEESDGAIQSAEDGAGRTPGPGWRGAVGSNVQTGADAQGERAAGDACGFGPGTGGSRRPLQLGLRVVLRLCDIIGREFTDPLAGRPHMQSPHLDGEFGDGARTLLCPR